MREVANLISRTITEVGAQVGTFLETNSGGSADGSEEEVVLLANHTPCNVACVFVIVLGSVFGLACVVAALYVMAESRKIELYCAEVSRKAVAANNEGQCGGFSATGSDRRASFSDVKTHAPMSS